MGISGSIYVSSIIGVATVDLGNFSDAVVLGFTLGRDGTLVLLRARELDNRMVKCELADLYGTFPAR